MKTNSDDLHINWNMYIGCIVEAAWETPVLVPEKKWKRKVLVAYLPGAQMPFVCAPVPAQGRPLQRGYSYCGYDHCRKIEPNNEDNRLKYTG